MNAGVVHCPEQPHGSLHIVLKVAIYLEHGFTNVGQRGEVDYRIKLIGCE